jgi:hypothetical protein
MSRNTRLLVFLLLALLWAIVIAAVAVQGWPRVPLDMSATDPATKAALAQAVTKHVLRHVALAVVPPLVMLALAWRWIRG